MGRYRKLPVEIEAVQWDGRLSTVIDFVTCEFSLSDYLDKALYIATLEGEMKADVGDWIIRGVKGEFYLCKPDLFAATYEAIS